MDQGLGEIFHKMIISDKIELSSFFKRPQKNKRAMSHDMALLLMKARWDCNPPHRAPSSHCFRGAGGRFSGPQASDYILIIVLTISRGELNYFLSSQAVSCERRMAGSRGPLPGMGFHV
jgi:hypothetical protein